MLCLKVLILFTCIIATTIDIVHSKYVHWPEIQRNIAQYKVIATWENAKKHCDRQGAVLASPIDAGLLKHMKSIIGINNHTTPYFIGIKARRAPELQFVSEEGILLEDIFEGTIYMIDEIDPEIGDCLCMDQHNIRAVSCSNRLPYMCYKNTTSLANAQSTKISTTDSSENSSENEESSNINIYTMLRDMKMPLRSFDCGSGYKLYFNGRCYKPYDYMSTTWIEANRTCFNGDGHLVIINDINEARLIMDIGFNLNKHFKFLWVGLHDESGNRDWRSVQGDKLNDLYNMGDLRRSRYDCAAIKYTGMLYDMECQGTKSFICEKPFSK